MNYMTGYGLYSPAQPFQTQMGATVPAMSQTSPVSQQSGFSCRPVTSREEAVATQVDFFSPGTVMPDLSHGVIYLKRINQQTGSADFMEFWFRAEEKKPEYVTRQEFEDFIKSIKQEKKSGKGDGDEK